VSSTTSTRTFLRSMVMRASLTALLLALASCSSSPSASSPGASQAAAARCAVTPDASPSATNKIVGKAFGADVTITAGQAVAFVNNAGIAHTVTEGTNGTAASNACVDEPIAAGGTNVVTFTQAGDYQITCKIHASMHTVVHVQ
jgi:plastocyanin